MPDFNANVFCFFLPYLHRDCAKPDSLYFLFCTCRSHDHELLLCQFVLFCPSQLIQQQYYICLIWASQCAPFHLLKILFDVYVLLVCSHCSARIFFQETACLFSFKWPLNTPEEDFSKCPRIFFLSTFKEDGPPLLSCMSKGMFHFIFIVTFFVFLCNVAHCY